MEQAPYLGLQAGHAAAHRGAQDGLAPAHDARAQDHLQLRQATGLQQIVIAADLGQQALCADTATT